jgi:hypothetical protein
VTVIDGHLHYDYSSAWRRPVVVPKPSKLRDSVGQVPRGPRIIRPNACCGRGVAMPEPDLASWSSDVRIADRFGRSGRLMSGPPNRPQNHQKSLNFGGKGLKILQNDFRSVRNSGSALASRKLMIKLLKYSTMRLKGSYHTHLHNPFVLHTCWHCR